MSCDTKYWSETQITRNAVFPGFNNSINIYTGFILIRIHMGVIDSKKQKKSNPCQSCSVVALVSLLEFAIFWGRTLWSLSLCQEFIREKRRFWFFLVGWFFKTTTKKPWTHCHSFISQSLPCLLGSSVQTCCVKMTVLWVYPYQAKAVSISLESRLYVLYFSFLLLAVI